MRARPWSVAVLLVAKLDRLSRSVKFIATVLDAGVEFRACDMPDASRMVLHIMAARRDSAGRRYGLPLPPDSP